MMRVKTSFVIPPTACDTKGRKSRRVGCTIVNHISQPIPASIGGVGPGTEHVVLPAREGRKRPAEAYSSLVGDDMIRENAITSCQCNVNGRVASSGVFSVHKPSTFRSWSDALFRYGSLQRQAEPHDETPDTLYVGEGEYALAGIGSQRG